MAVDFRRIATGAGDGGAVIADIVDQGFFDTADLGLQFLRRNARGDGHEARQAVLLDFFGHMVGE